MKRLLVMFLALVCFACKGSSQSWPPQPVEVHAGEDTCAECKMIISDEHHGAQFFQRNNAVQVFDDFGCLRKHRSLEISENTFFYVRAYQDGKWIPGDQAFFLISPEIASPMGYGIAAFTTRETAAYFARSLRSSQIFSSAELPSIAEFPMNSESSSRDHEK